MAKYLIDDTALSAIADAIRTKKGGTTQYKPSEMPDAIMSIGGSENGTILRGSFTPAAADNASGKSIQIAVPKVPRAVMVAVHTSDTTTIDRYAPEAVTTFNYNSVPAVGQSALTCARYKSSTTDATTLTQGVSYSAYPFGNYTTTNASSYGYTICCTASKVHFKTNGNYRFRTGVQYDYIIILD